MNDSRYLIETSYDPDEPHTILLLTADELSDWLTKNIEMAHYAGDASTIHGMYRYESPGHLVELIMVPGGTNTEDDYIDTFYRLHDKSDADGFGPCDENEDFGFTVRIDGRV